MYSAVAQGQGVCFNNFQNDNGRNDESAEGIQRVLQSYTLETEERAWRMWAFKCGTELIKHENF